MGSRRRLESYLQVDHRQSPGFDRATAERAGFGKHAVGSVNYETALVHCSHCSRGVLLNPDRSRERAFCRTCDAYLCDQCGLARSLGAACLPMAKILDDAQEAAFRAEQLGTHLLIP